MDQSFDLVAWFHCELQDCQERDKDYDLASVSDSDEAELLNYESSTDSEMPTLRTGSSSEDTDGESVEIAQDSTKEPPRQLGDLLGESVRLILEVSQPYPGDERTAHDERRRLPRFYIERIMDDCYTVRDEYFYEISVLPLEYLRVPAFSLASWYANIRAVELGIEDFGFLRTHQGTIKELLADEVKRYLSENSLEYPALQTTLVRRILREPDDLDGPDLYLIQLPVNDTVFVDFISERDLTNPFFDLIGWIFARQGREINAENDLLKGFSGAFEISYLGTVFGDEDLPQDEVEFFCGKAQIPADGYNGLRRTSSTPRTANRVVAKPIVVVALVNRQPVRALIDSGSLGDLISTPVADQLKLEHTELDDPIVLQLAVQGSRSKINHSVSVDFQYQELRNRRTFYIANLSGYDMILGTSWLYQHKVTIGLNPARFCIGSANALPLDGIATAKVYTNAMKVENDAMEVVCNELLEYAKPICQVASETPLPPLRAINHEIPLIDENKISPWRPSRCPEALRAQWDEKRKVYLNTGRWKITNSGNTAPMLLIPKAKSSPPRLRVVVDLRARNANTRKMTSPLPDMDGILRRASRCPFRSLIDGQDAYEQIRIKPEHVERTAMGTPDGNMVSLVLQQGNCNAPAT